MRYSNISAFIGCVIVLFGTSMLFALPWSFPVLGQTETIDYRSIFALLVSMLVCGVIGGVLLFLSRKTPLSASLFKKFRIFIRSIVHFKAFRALDRSAVLKSPSQNNELYINQNPENQFTLLHRETIAIVGLSWILIGILGALPFILAGIVRDVTPTGQLVYADVADCLFESFSGVTGFGATVLRDVENSDYIPKAVQFWRCELHFLGGLGIMVLFVAILGGRSAGKSLMQTETLTTPNESRFVRAQETAFNLLKVYLVLNTCLIILLYVEGMPIYDAVCHSFSTVATGGFSSRNNSVGAFHSGWIELTLTIFMFISSCNFTLLCLVGMLPAKKSLVEKLIQPFKNLKILFKNTEFLVFVGTVVTAIFLVSGSCWLNGDCVNSGESKSLTWNSFWNSFRYGGFQVVSIISSTGFGTTDFNNWNDFSRGVLFVLMFTGACVGSTTCGLKIMRLIILWKTLGIEIERIFRPNVVRVICLQGKPVEDTDELRRNVLSYFALYSIIFVGACLLLLAIEPSSTWTNNGFDKDQQMYDSITTVATAYNCVGPSFGITGVTQTFGVFHAPAKCLFVLLMLLGRLELFVVIAMFSPKLWSRQLLPNQKKDN